MEASVGHMFYPGKGQTALVDRKGTLVIQQDRGHNGVLGPGDAQTSWALGMPFDPYAVHART